MSIGHRIRQARERLEMTQEELGALVGVSRIAINHWERERRLPEGRHLKLLAESLKTTADYLLDVKKVRS